MCSFEMSENGVYIKDRTRFPPVLLKPEKRTELFRSNILLGIIHSVMLTIRTHNQTVNCCSLEVCSYEQFHVMFWALHSYLHNGAAYITVDFPSRSLALAFCCLYFRIYSSISTNGHVYLLRSLAGARARNLQFTKTQLFISISLTATSESWIN